PQQDVRGAQGTDRDRLRCGRSRNGRDLGRVLREAGERRVTLLLDTNALLWILHDSPRLGSRARKALLDTPRILVSEISLLEIAVKTSVGKLPAEPRLHSTLRELG